MDLDDRLDLLADAARYDLCADFSTQGRRHTPAPASWFAPDDAVARRADRPVFRVLSSSRCAWNCSYCPLRADSDLPRAVLEPEELALTFLPRYEAGLVQGLFLSTAVDGDVGQATGRMLDSVELLRTRFQYSGYVHVKLLPAVSGSDVERAARLADRISLNLEAPTPAHLAHIAPERNWQRDLIERLVWTRDWQREAGLIPSGLANSVRRRCRR
jgi:predicted DNA-binding helix-hairpin-helix protein